MSSDDTPKADTFASNRSAELRETIKALRALLEWPDPEYDEWEPREFALFEEASSEFEFYDPSLSPEERALKAKLVIELSPLLDEMVSLVEKLEDAGARLGLIEPAKRPDVVYLGRMSVKEFSERFRPGRPIEEDVSGAPQLPS